MTAGAVVETFPVGMLQCNCSIVVDEASREAVVIDPGDEPDRILKALDAAGVTAVALLHTHAHFDHVTGTRAIARATRAPILLHPGDAPLYEALPDQAALFGLSAETPLPVSRDLGDGDIVRFGASQIRVLHTPGHTPGSTCFELLGETPLLFSGDTLFRRSIGRTDLWGGDTDTILSSIRGRLFTLAGDLRVVCGHGPDTTIAEERRSNPFAATSSAR